MSPNPTRTTRTTRTGLLVTAGLILGCQSPKSTCYRTITVGMTAADVESILGPPSSRLHAQGLPPHPWNQRWHWGDTVSTAITSGVFRDQPPPPQIGAVWFDAEGHVLRVQTPGQPHELALDSWDVPPR